MLLRQADARRAPTVSDRRLQLLQSKAPGLPSGAADRIEAEVVIDGGQSMKVKSKNLRILPLG